MAWLLHRKRLLARGAICVVLGIGVSTPRAAVNGASSSAPAASARVATPAPVGEPAVNPDTEPEYTKTTRIPDRAACGETRSKVGGQLIRTPNLGRYESRCRKIRHLNAAGQVVFEQEQCGPPVFKGCV